MPLHSRGLTNKSIQLPFSFFLWLNPFIFHSLVHLVFILVYGMRYGYKLSLFPNCEPIWSTEFFFFDLWCLLYHISNFIFYYRLLIFFIGIMPKAIEPSQFSLHVYFCIIAGYLVILTWQLCNLLWLQSTGVTVYNRVLCGEHHEDPERAESRAPCPHKGCLSQSPMDLKKHIKLWASPWEIFTL